VNNSNGTAINFFDMYSFGTTRSTFQIDANFGAPTAALEMLVYSHPGLIELLPALPTGWSASGTVTGIGARNGFTVDVAWSNGQATSATIRSAVGGTTTVKFGSWSQSITVAPGGSVTVTPAAQPTGTFLLINRRSSKALDVPGSSTTAGTGLIQYTRHGGANQQWRFSDSGGVYKVANVNSGLVADVNGGGSADGTTIIQWTDTGATNQQWRVVDAGGGYVKLVNVRSGKLLAVRGDSTANSAVIEQQTDTGDISQHWQRIPV